METLGTMLALVALLATSVTAGLFDGRGGSFTLQVAKPSGHQPDFINAWAAARRKWGARVLDDTEHVLALAKDESNIEVQPFSGDMMYLAEVQIGNPPQTLKMALDTGSSDVWVHSNDTRYRTNVEGPWPAHYSPNASTTASQVEQAAWSIVYVDATSAIGIVYRDTLRIGDVEVKDASIQSAVKLSDTFEIETGFSGIVGLAKNLNNTIVPPEPTFLSLFQRQLRSPVFTIDLRANASSRVDFGRVDESIASDNMTWLQSDPAKPHWVVDLELTSWTGNQTIWLYYKFAAVVDTGTSVTFLPGLLVDRYWSQVPGAEMPAVASFSYCFPCAVGNRLPDLMFKLSGTEHVLTIPGRYFNFGPTRYDPSMCWGGLQSSGQLDNASILGDTVLKALVVAFDMEKGRVGFANKELHDGR